MARVGSASRDIKENSPNQFGVIDPYSFSLNNVSMRFGARILFEDVNATFVSGRRYAITGRNGAGSSRLETAQLWINAATEEYTDMISAGTIDPAKVSRSALQTAASIAGLMLIAEALVSEVPEAERAAPMPGGDAQMY